MKEIVIPIILQIIIGIFAVVVALINNGKLNKQSRERKMNSAKQSILLMIQEDYMAVELMKKLPDNHQRILHEYKEYTDNNGNGIVKEKVDEYLKWYSELNLENK